MKKISKNKKKKNTASRKKHLLRGSHFFIKIVIFNAFIAVMGCSFILIHDMVTQCKYFSAKKIEIVGNSRLETEYILKIAEISENMNILGLNISVARKRLMSHPWIEEVDIKRNIPDGIIITVKEHKPLAIVDIGQYFLINSKGQLIKKLSQEAHLSLPIVNGLELEDINAYHKGSTNNYSAVLDILKLGKKMNTGFSNKHIKNINVDRETGITIHTDKTIKTIKLGFNNYEKKYKRIKDLLLVNKKTKHGTEIGGIDLHNPNRVVITPASRT